MQPVAHPTPDLFWETLTGFQRSAAIKAAVELDIFTKISEGNHTAGAIAEACGATADRGVRILCDSLTVMGFLTKENDSYNLTESTAFFLVSTSPAYLGGTT